MWPNPQETADLVKFTEEIFNRKPLFLCSDPISIRANFSGNIKGSFVWSKEGYFTVFQ